MGDFMGEFVLEFVGDCEFVGEFIGDFVGELVDFVSKFVFEFVGEFVEKLNKNRDRFGELTRQSLMPCVLLSLLHAVFVSSGDNFHKQSYQLSVKTF